MALQEVKDLEKRVAALEKKAGVGAEKVAGNDPKFDQSDKRGAKPQAGG